MSTNRAQLQTLLDEWAIAIRRSDIDRTLMLRRTLDKKIDDLFIELARKPAPPRPPPPPPERRTIPPKVGPCPSCNGTGRREEGNAILRCRACDGEGKVLVAPPRFA